MKLFTAMESYQQHSDVTEEEMDELLETIGNQQRETAMMLETYSDATEALKNLKRVEETRVTDRGVYGVTMESLADQLGYPAGSTFTSEGIGESIKNFAKKVWAKIVAAWHAVRNWIRKLFGMTPIPSAAELVAMEAAIAAAVRKAFVEDPLAEEAAKNMDMDKVNREIAEQHEKNLAEIMDNGNLMDILKNETSNRDAFINKSFKAAAETLSKEERERVTLPVLAHAILESTYSKYSDDAMAKLYAVSDIEAIKRVFKDAENGTPNNENVSLNFESVTFRSSGGLVENVFDGRFVSESSTEKVKGIPEILHKQILWVKRACDNVGDLLSHAVDEAFRNGDAKVKFGRSVGLEVESLTYRLVTLRGAIQTRDKMSRILNGD